MELFRLLGKIVVDNDEANASIEGTTEKAASMGSALGTTLQDAGAKITSVGTKLLPLTVAIGGLAYKSIQWASDTEEATNKVDVAFGDSADKVKAFADTALTTYGISKGTALDMAALFGDMGTSMGLTTDQAAEMSTSLVGLAGDLASFKNISTDQAMTALNGIFTGETESLKSLGIVMTQTNLDAYALSNGFGKTTKEMSQSELVALRYQYVMSMTSNAQGDFARTSDGTANQMRIATESIKEAGASIGAILLPYVAKALSVFNEWTQKFAQLNEKTQKTIIVIAGIVAAIGPALMVIGTVVSGIGAIITAVSTMAGVISAGGTVVTALVAAFGAVNIAAVAIVAAIAAVIAIGAYLYTHWDEIKQQAQLLKEELGQVWENIKTSISKAWDNIKKKTSAVFDSIYKYLTRIWNNVKSKVSSVVESIRSKITSVWNGIKSVTSSVWNAIKSAITNPIGTAQSILTGYINIIKTLLSFAGLSGTVSSVFNSVKSAITAPIESAKSTISGYIESIKGFFSNLSLRIPTPSLPSLPHFSLRTSSKTILGKEITYPTGFDVSWYAQGGIFDSPTIIPTLNGLKGVGEAGAEAVAPIDKLKDYVREAMLEVNGSGIEELTEVVKALYSWLTRGGLQNVMIDVLENHISITFEGREVARVVRKYA